MSIVDGYKKVKRYIQTDDGHELMSQWTSSDTVETDGKTLTETLATKADLDTNGKVKLEQIPKVALDNLIKVENDTARFALTTDDVQTGDTVKVLESNDGSGERMYLVVDDTKLDSEDGYTGYSATTTWETIEGKPDDIGQVVHITQAEYDALDDTKLTDDVVYMITDAEGGGSAGGVSSWEDLQDKPTNLVYSEEGEATAIEVPQELTTNDIVDDLNTNDATKVLSAKQGFHLNYIMERVVGADIAEYSEDSTYAVGDYCIYADSLYRCHTAINTPIAFDDTGHWEITTFSNEIKTLNNKNILEQGLVSGVGYYRKYADGTLELWSRMEKSLTFPNTFLENSMYYSDQIIMPLAIQPVSVKYMGITAFNSGVSWAVRPKVVDKTITFNVMQGGANERSTELEYYIIGTWE